MAQWIRTKPRDLIIFEEEVFTDEEIREILEYDFKIKKLPSDDLMFICHTNTPRDILGFNDTASIILNETVWGPVLICSQEEYQNGDS